MGADYLLTEDYLLKTTYKRLLTKLIVTSIPTNTRLPHQLDYNIN